jgi:type IV secretory pathway VirB6-like protein
MSQALLQQMFLVGAILAIALWNRISERAGARPAPTFAFFNTPQCVKLFCKAEGSSPNAQSLFFQAFGGNGGSVSFLYSN